MSDDVSDDVLELELLVVDETQGDITIDGVVARTFEASDGRVVPEGQPFTFEVRPNDDRETAAVVATLQGWIEEVSPVVVGPAMSDHGPVLVMAGERDALVLRLG